MAVWNENSRERICWIRKMASTIQPSEEEMYSLANNVPFDDRVNHFAERNDLNITLRVMRMGVI